MALLVHIVGGRSDGLARKDGGTCRLSSMRVCLVDAQNGRVAYGKSRAVHSLIIQERKDLSCYSNFNAKIRP